MWSKIIVRDESNWLVGGTCGVVFIRYTGHYSFVSCLSIERDLPVMSIEM